MRARKYRVASNDTVLSATRYGPYARLSRIISCRYTVVITDFSVSPYIMSAEATDINNLLSRSQNLACSKRKDGDK